MSETQQAQFDSLLSRTEKSLGVIKLLFAALIALVVLVFTLGMTYKGALDRIDDHETRIKVLEIGSRETSTDLAVIRDRLGVPRGKR